ncbi:Na/Pi cotransporter family protein [Anaerostipes sp.]|uniref:Na/Pi cotransporter family protein n=1 Tax=Anaerostipes sp. TaxID=1872530 RepID=UPI002585D980|nr:Na/Pi cotransporter family protein [Anaerostipes sp.]MCI5622787.1 Na/Pi cotransporter family protein [Anaerostipes sp.]MDY2725664.1 Na/Pi cotransporter family protein [Anaerostipes faecalis]
MNSTIILGLLGGLALFLYGMQMMSAGLESAAGDKMKEILERLTSNRFLGVLVGAVITAVIQSSSATTVMVVGFVNSGMMTLNQAVWIIMGANIGTTITGQLIALDVGAMAPLIAFIGVAMIVFMKNPKIQYIGQIFAGLGILFIGMNMMGDAMVPLRDFPPFINLMTRFSNPAVGILAGMVFTALIQSSSASVGILQALALSGVISLRNAAFVLFGQNIGTCITAVLASIGTERNAKRTTIIHLLFNIIGTVIFTVVCLVFPLTDYVAAFSGSSITRQIANMHTLFNITTSILLIPFGNQLAALAVKILPEKEEEKEHHKHLKYMKEVDTSVDATIGTAAIYMEGMKKEISRMLEMARINVEKSFQACLQGNSQSIDDVEKREEYIDYLNKEISRAISKMMIHETNEKNSKNIGSYFDITGNIERIGDHAVNICDYTKLIEENNIKFSDESLAEIEEMRMICAGMFRAVQEITTDDATWLEAIHDSENYVDEKTEEFYQKHLERIKRGECNDEACIIFSEMLTDFERIGDHIWNVAKQIGKIKERN